MIETASYKAAHHQNQTIEHLRYENELLLKRNQLLSEENKRLLEQLDHCLNTVLSNEAMNIQKVVLEQQQLSQKARQEWHTLFNGLDKKMEKLIGGLVASYRESLQSKRGSISHVYDHLTSIITKLLSEKTEQKEVQLKQYINSTEERLLMRKNARDKTSQVVHLIKQPPKELNLQYRDLREQVEQLRDFYHRLIRKIKKDSVNIHALESIYEEIHELTEVRWKLKQQEAKLSILQRQFELGNFYPTNHQTISSLISQLADSSKSMKASIQSKLQSLS